MPLRGTPSLIFNDGRSDMADDIQILIERLKAEFPDLKIQQLAVAHPGVDDEGVWFCRREGRKEEVQFESSSRDFPFSAETSVGDERLSVATVEEAITVIQTHLYDR